MKRTAILVFLGVVSTACSGAAPRGDAAMQVLREIDSHIEQGKYHFRARDFPLALRELSTAEERIKDIQQRIEGLSDCYDDCATGRVKVLQLLREANEGVQTYQLLTATEVFFESWQTDPSNASVQSMCQGLAYVMERASRIEQQDRARVVNLMKRVVLIVANTPNTQQCRENLVNVAAAMGETS